MAHHDRSIRERVIVLAEEGGLSASTAGELYGVPKSTARAWLQKYRRDWQVGRRRGTGLWRVSSPTQDATLVTEVQRNSFVSARELKNPTGFPGQKKNTLISRLREAGLRTRHAAVKEFLTDENKLYHLAFSESNVDRMWDRVIFSDDSIFISAKDGPVLVYRPRGECYNSQCMSTCTHIGRESVLFWGWISHEGAGMLYHIGHLDSLQYKHILQNEMVPSVRMLYPDSIIHLQQNHSSIHDSREIQEWLLLQADVELIDWPPRAPVMNPIENMWSEVKRTMQEAWPVPPPRNSDKLWTLVSEAWDEFTSSQFCV